MLNRSLGLTDVGDTYKHCLALIAVERSVDKNNEPAVDNTSTVRAEDKVTLWVHHAES